MSLPIHFRRDVSAPETRDRLVGPRPTNRSVGPPRTAGQVRKTAMFADPCVYTAMAIHLRGRSAWRSSPGRTALVFAGKKPVANKSPKKQAPPKKLTTKEKKAKKNAKLAAKKP